MDDLMTPAERRRRHAAWLAGFGFSAEDKRRIRLLAEEVTPNYSPPALDDLSVPFRVAAVMPSSQRWMGGDLLGVMKCAAGDVALLVWKMTERVRETWARRR